MKKMMLFVVILSCSLGQAQVASTMGSVPIPVESGAVAHDSELIARAFLDHEIIRYEGWFSFWRIPVSGGESRWVSGNFMMRPDGWVTELSIDGVVIVAPGDEPLAGLPANRDGSAIEYHLGLNGIDSENQFAVYGNFYTDLLLPSDPITVVLHPSYEERFVSFVAPYGVSPDALRIRVNNDNGIWTYDVGRDGFSLWLDPGARYTYEIFNQITGEIYERGDIDDPATTGDNIVSAKYGNVDAMLMDWSQSWADLQNTTFNHSVERGNVPIPAKVIMTRAHGQQMLIQANYLPSNGHIEVRAWQETGEMPIVVIADAVYQNDEVGKGDGGYYWAYVVTPVGYDRLVITITGTSEGQSFDVYLSRGGEQD